VDDNAACSKDGVDEVGENDNICAEESVLFDSGDCDDCVHDVAALDSSFLFNRID
jgi:hypothetical protein